MTIVAPATIGLDHFNDESKDVYAEILRFSLKKGNGIALINLMECWTCDSVDGDEQAMMSWFEEHGTFKNHQNHKEKVVLSVEHEDLHGGLMWMAEILRSEGEPARLGPWIAQSDGEQMQGRFYGFFNEPASA